MVMSWVCPLGCPHSAVKEFVSGNKTQYGWLVENGESGDKLRYRTMHHGMLLWTANHNEALRFCRKIDAERFSEEDPEAGRVVEHAWNE